jgi:hypothetical protein
MEDFNSRKFNLSIIDEPKSNELIISFEHYNPKQLSELQSQLSSVTGIKQLGYCEKMHVFYFEFDPSVFRSADQAFEAIMLKTKAFQPLMKVGARISQVQTECNK